MTFVVAGVVLLLALLVGVVFDDDEPSKDDPAIALVYFSDAR